jgi:hypothetical protein
MTPSATAHTRIAERVPRWSSTSHASARPDSRPALHSTPHSSPRAVVIGAEATPIGLTSTRNHTTATPPRVEPTLIAAIKSP